MDAQAYAVLVVVVMALHAAVIAFNVGALAAIAMGGPRRWAWVRNLAFRVAHLVLVAVVVATTWIGESCSLTALEQWLRSEANLSTYGGGFIQHWLGAIIYVRLPTWVFTVAYSVFGAAVVAAWLLVPPTVPRRGDGRGHRPDAHDVA